MKIKNWVGSFFLVASLFGAPVFACEDGSCKEHKGKATCEHCDKKECAAKKDGKKECKCEKCASGHGKAKKKAAGEHQHEGEKAE